MRGATVGTGVGTDQQGVMNGRQAITREESAALAGATDRFVFVKGGATTIDDGAAYGGGEAGGWRRAARMVPDIQQS